MTHQTENGFTRIADSLLDAMLLADLSKREILITLCVVRYTYGFQRKSHLLTAGFVAAATGIPRQHAAATISAMVQRGILTRKKTQNGNRLGLRKAFFPSPETVTTGSPDSGTTETPASPDSVTTGSPETVTTVVPKQVHKKDRSTDKEKDNDRSFDHFWHGYPRRVAKARAAKVWRNLSKADQAAAIAALPHWPFPAEAQYQPHATTWLNQRRWEDEPDPTPTTQRSNGNGRTNGRHRSAGERASDFYREQQVIIEGSGRGEQGSGDGVVVDMDGRLLGTSTWLAHAPVEAKPAWAAILGGRTGEDLKRGMRKLRESPPAYPPGAAAFNRLCAEYQPGTFSAGAPRPLPAPATLLENATVRGDARAYLDMCRRVIDEGGLTRAELETLPPCVTGGGHIVRPRDYCTAVDDEGFVKGEKQPHPERCA